jgi:hypothetical protein
MPFQSNAVFRNLEDLPPLSAGCAFRVYPLRAERAEAGNLNPEKK